MKTRQCQYKKVKFLIYLIDDRSVVIDCSGVAVGAERGRSAEPLFANHVIESKELVKVTFLIVALVYSRSLKICFQKNSISKIHVLN
jgi:hypothetical protein